MTLARWEEGRAVVGGARTRVPLRRSELRRVGSGVHQMMRARLVALQRVLRHACAIRSSGRALAAPCLAVIIAAPGAAQPLYDGERVNKLSFVGVQQLSSSELGEVIVTEKRRCKSILFTPICLISNSGTFEAKPTLDLEELERDELRIRVHYWRAGYRRAEAEARVE